MSIGWTQEKINALKHMEANKEPIRDIEAEEKTKLAEHAINAEWARKRAMNGRRWGVRSTCTNRVPKRKKR
jgi:hypothetical protein